MLGLPAGFRNPMNLVHPSWKPLFDQYDFDLDALYSEPVYPPRESLFQAFAIPVEEIRVVLLGQDPYHGPGQAHGLSFSVPPGVPVPPSLRNIFKELLAEFPERRYVFDRCGGCLQTWADREKIFLLNASLSVLAGKASSHMGIWQEFTDDVIRWIAAKNKRCVFLLLGNFAKVKSALIEQKEKIVTGIHPSPLAHGFLGSGVFKKVEAALGESIDWTLSGQTE